MAPKRKPKAAPKKGPSARPAGSLTPQQKFAKNCGAAYRSLGDQKSLFAGNYMAFCKACRQHKDHLTMTPDELKRAALAALKNK